MPLLHHESPLLQIIKWDGTLGYARPSESDARGGPQDLSNNNGTGHRNSACTASVEQGSHYTASVLLFSRAPLCF